MAVSKVVLIDPRGWQGAASGYRPVPNVGIAYLIPMLREQGHEVLAIDMNNEAMTDEQVLATIDEFCPDIIGLSVKTATMKMAHSLAKQVKRMLPKVPVILGGPHTKLAWRDLVAQLWFDVVFVGEGEHVLPNMCHRLTAGERIEDLPGVVTKSNCKDGFSLNGPLIAAADLNALPFPEYDVFPNNVRVSLRAAYPLVTSRGCVYKCTYCCVPEISGRRFRERSPNSVIEELRWAQKKYNITRFEIIDDIFNLDIKRCKQICRALIEADLGMSWSCGNGLRADRVDRELAKLMYKSGCHNVMIGVESVAPDVLATVKKGERIEDIERCIRFFKEVGIHVGGYFIIGLPGDSFQTQERSVDFAKKMGISAHFNMLVPYPGTELWEWAKTNARFLHDIENGLHFADSSEKVKPLIESDDFTASERQKAYEMVHTKLGRFDMIIPPNVSRWQYHRRMLTLLWHYDRRQLQNYIFRRLFRKFQRLFVRLIRMRSKRRG